MFKKLWSLFAGSETRESTASTWRTECLELDPPPSGASKPVEPTTLPPIIRREPVDVALAEAQVGIKQFLARIDDAITRRDIVLTPDERTDGKLFSAVFEGHTISIRARHRLVAANRIEQQNKHGTSAARNHPRPR